MMFVAKIHNSSLGACFEVESEAEGIDFIRGMAEDQLDRPLTDEEIDELHNNLELFNDEDMDNHYTWSIGTFG
jgi:hypothetical protein